MKKFEEVAMNEKNPNWKKAIKRETELYNPVLSDYILNTDSDNTNNVYVINISDEVYATPYHFSSEAEFNSYNGSHDGSRTI